MKRILVLDTGKEWGGGTNSLLELLKRADGGKYAFSALFYANYKRGSKEPAPDVKTEVEKTGTSFMTLTHSRKYSSVSKALKEAMRALLFFSPSLRKSYVFRHDYKNRIEPAASAIASVIKKGHFDALYMNNQPSSNLEGILAAKAAGVPCIQHSRIEVKLNKTEAAAANEGISKVICVSGGVRDSLVGSGVDAARCVVVYNGIDPDFAPRIDRQAIRRSLGVSPSEFLVGTVGSLIKRKRVDLLVDAAAALKGRPARFVVVGEGPEEGALKKEAARAGVADTVHFAGFSNDALSYINAMDAFVLPSAKEGLPRVILEAMLMSRPVIAFDVVGPNELIEDGVNGLLVKDGESGALARAIERVMDDGASALSMGRAARERVVSRFAIDRYVRGVEAVFDEVLGA